MKPAIIRPELELKHEIKEVPARNVIYIRLFGDYKLNDYCSAWMRLCQFIQEEKLPMAAGLTEEEKERVKENMEKNILPLLEKYPDTVFYLFYPPYSILYWDLLEKDGMIRSQLEAEEMVTDLLLSYDNVRLFSFYEDTDLICNLDNYRDKEHYISDINSYLLEQMSQGRYEITAGNQEEHMDFMRQFYLNFDYDAFVKEQETETDPG